MVTWVMNWSGAYARRAKSMLKTWMLWHLGE